MTRKSWPKKLPGKWYEEDLLDFVASFRFFLRGLRIQPVRSSDDVLRSTRVVALFHIFLPFFLQHVLACARDLRTNQSKNNTEATGRSSLRGLLHATFRCLCDRSRFLRWWFLPCPRTPRSS